MRCDFTPAQPLAFPRIRFECSPVSCRDRAWPGGARVAVSIVVNFEEGAEFSVTDGDPENEAVYEIEQRLAGRPDPAIDSHFEYGSRAGWWRIMEVLALEEVSSQRRRCLIRPGCGARPEGYGSAAWNPEIGRHLARLRRSSRFVADLYGAFPVKRLFLGFPHSSLFGAGKERPFFVPSPAIRFAERAEGVKGPKR